MANCWVTNPPTGKLDKPANRQQSNGIPTTVPLRLLHKEKNAKTFVKNTKTVKNVLILAKSVIVFVVLAVHNRILPKNAEQKSIWYIGYVGYYRQ